MLNMSGVVPVSGHSMKRLDTVTQHKSNNQLEETDSKDLLKLLSSSPSLYEGIELVLRAAFEASIKLSVESVAESVISVYNLHNTKLRAINEETADDELFVVYNGPEIGEAEEVLSEALDLHFKDSRGWHFTTNNLFKSSGPTVTSILKRKNILNIY